MASPVVADLARVIVLSSTGVGDGPPFSIVPLAAAVVTTVGMAAASIDLLPNTIEDAVVDSWPRREGSGMLRAGSPSGLVSVGTSENRLGRDEGEESEAVDEEECPSAVVKAAAAVVG